MQFADLKRWRSFCIHEPCHLHLQVLVCICLHLLEIVLKPSWSLLEISRSLLEIFSKLTLHVPAQVLTKNYDSPGAKFWLNLAMTHTRLLRLATVGVGAYRRSISLSWLQHATTVFRFWESWHSAHYRGTTAGESCWTQCRPCAQGRDRDDPFEMSGQVRSSQVNKIKQVHEIAKVATFALSREKLYLSNLWIDSQVMHANKQMRAFLPTKTESPWFWSWSPIIYVEVSQQLLVQSTQDFGGQMLQQLPEILLLRFIIRPIELDGHFCKCGLSCVLFF